MGPGNQFAYLGRRGPQNYPLTMEPVCIVLEPRYEDYSQIVWEHHRRAATSWGDRKGSRNWKMPPGFITCLTKQLFAKTATTKVRVVYDASSKESKSVAC